MFAEFFGEKAVDFGSVCLSAAEILPIQPFHPGIHGKSTFVAEGEQGDAVGDLIPHTRVCDERFFQPLPPQFSERGKVRFQEHFRVAGDIFGAVAESECAVKGFVLCGDVGKCGKGEIIPPQKRLFPAERGAEGKEHLPDAGDVVLLGEDEGEKALRPVLPQDAQSLGKFRGAREEGDAEGLRLFDERGGVRIHIEQIFEIRSVPVLADKAGDFALFAEKTGFVRGKEEISAPFFVAEKPEYLSAFQGGCGGEIFAFVSHLFHALQCSTPAENCQGFSGGGRLPAFLSRRSRRPPGFFGEFRRESLPQIRPASGPKIRFAKREKGGRGAGKGGREKICALSAKES